MCFPGSGAFPETFPLKAGDTVLLVFSSSSIDRWLSLGGEVDPIDDRRHHITDAMAIPGLRSMNAALPSTALDPNARVIGGPIKLGDNTAVDAVLKGDTFLSAFHTLITAIGVAAATPSTATTGINTALATFEGVASTYKSTVVKVK